MRVLVLAVLLAGCSTPTGPDIPEGAVPFNPPAAYARWWRDVEGRAEMTRIDNRVQWFLVPGLFDSRDGRLASGRWVNDGRIYLAEGWEMDQRTVKHEMLHEILRGDEEHRHPLFATYDAQSCLDRAGALIPCPL